MSGTGVSALCARPSTQFTMWTTEKLKAYLKSPSISTPFKRVSWEGKISEHPVKKILFPLTILMAYILPHSLHGVPLHVSGNCVKALKAGCASQ